MLLSNLVKGLKYTANEEFEDIEILDICYDSRKVNPNTMFVCLKGARSDGHDFAPKAVELGAAVLIVEEFLDLDCLQIKVDDSRKALALLAANFYDNPSKDLTLIGVTGTNGKTTITHMIKSILQPFRGIGLIGTIGVLIGSNEYLPTNNTTPESLEFHGILAKMRTKNIDTVVTEVSSHGLEGHRVDFCDFDYAVFSNLSHDHLDFHGTMENYFKAKSQLFSKLKNGGIAVINIDDPYGERLAKEIKNRKVVTYGLSDSADCQGIILEKESLGKSFIMRVGQEEVEINLPLIGEYNVLNALAASCVAIGLGYSIQEIKKGLDNLTPVPGRLENYDFGQEFQVYIDYAHTPDGLNKVLEILSRLNKNKLITVFGCTGDSDKTKRHVMAEVSEKYSDLSIVTTNSPKFEDPKAILDDIAKGFTKDNYRVIEKRDEAIIYALDNAQKDDIVLIAGKGHEKYQIIKGAKVPHSDKNVVNNYFNNKYNKKD